METQKYLLGRYESLQGCLYLVAKSEPDIYDVAAHDYWSEENDDLRGEIASIVDNLTYILDKELDAYMELSSLPKAEPWSKAQACRLLRQAYVNLDDPVLTMPLKDFFINIANAVACIPRVYQKQVVQEMARKLEDWKNISRDDLRAAVQHIGFNF